MNESFANFHQSNPFSTRYTAPGKTPFFFEKSFVQYIKASRPAKFQELFSRALGLGEDVRNSICLRYLVDQFESHSRRGQIVGAHGSGKTSLMLALKEELIKEGYEIFTWTLHDQARFLPDVFWTELQQFLQSVPVFLPSKCLLPPPVMSKEEYLSQQRRSMVEIFGKDAELRGNATVDSQAEKKNGGVEEFSVSETDAPKEAPNDSDASSGDVNEEVDDKTSREQADARGERNKSAVFGFNEAGNFGLRKTSDAGGLFKELDEPIKFAPFKELDSVDDLDDETSVADDDDEEYDEVEIVEAATAQGLSGDSFREILSTDAKDFDRRRSLFEKKALFFDGFEQLSYVNRIIIRTFCRMNQLGLLLTTHKPAIGVPVLFRTIPSVEILRELLKFLLEEVDMGDEMSDSELETLLKNFHYDVREILFSMYDAYENYRLAPRDVREQIVRRYPR